MIIEISKEQLNGIPATQFSLGDESCHPEENETHVIFRSRLTDCRTERKMSKSRIVYSNKIHGPVGQNRNLSKGVAELLDISCSFQTTSSISSRKFRTRLLGESDLAMYYTTKKGKILPDVYQKEVMNGKSVFIVVVAKNVDEASERVIIDQCYLVENKNGRERIVERLISKG